MNVLQVELLDGSGDVVDVDWFRFAKQKGKVLLNPKPDGTAPKDPQFAIKPLNQLAYDELGMVAARQFLRRQGMISREQWAPVAVTQRKGQPVASLAPDARWAASVGAELVVDTGIAGEGQLKQIRSEIKRPGTVTVISTDYDGFVDAAGLKDDVAVVLAIRGTPGVPAFQIRSFVRFPLAALPANDLVSIADVTVNVQAVVPAGPPETVRIQAYNKDGQADPNADAGAANYTRTKDDLSPYLSGIPQWQAIGLYTHSLPQAAQDQIMVNKAAVDRFSLGFAHDQDENTFTKLTFIEAIEAVTTGEVKLALTHKPLDGRMSRNRGQVVSGDGLDMSEMHVL